MNNFNYEPSEPRGTVDFDLDQRYQEVIDQKIKICFSIVKKSRDFKWDDKKSKANNEKIKFVKFMQPIMYISELTPDKFIELCNDKRDKRPYHIHCYYQEKYDWHKAFDINELGIGTSSEQMDAYQFGIGNFARFLGFFVGSHFLVRLIDPDHKFSDKYKK